MDPASLRTVRLIERAPIAEITLARPEKRNAFDDVMIRELREALDRLTGMPGLRAVVLAGEGPTFCAGADLDWMRRTRSWSYQENLADALELARLLRDIDVFPCPILARVHGPAIGGGAGLVAACDLAVASSDAAFAFSEVRLGLSPACISPYVLRRIGARATRELFLTGNRFDAERALAIGLVETVVPAAELDGAVQAYLDLLLLAGPKALGATKTLLAKLTEAEGSEVERYTSELIAALRVGEEGQEGVGAFLEKRPPGWHPKGRTS